MGGKQQNKRCIFNKTKGLMSNLLPWYTITLKEKDCKINAV